MSGKAVPLLFCAIIVVRAQDPVPPPKLDPAELRFPVPQRASDISELTIGTPRDDALAALRERYTLKKMPFDFPDPEAWDVYDKKTGSEAGSLRFDKGRLALVSVRIFEPMHGEAVRFAERMYRWVHARADPPQNPNLLDKVTDIRTALAIVQAEERRGDRLDEQIITITMGDTALRIIATRLEGYAPQVVMYRVDSERK